MSTFKSLFVNIMVERGFYNQCTNEQGFDDFLYQVFNNAKISFDHLAIPQEYYGIYLHFHELGDH